GGFREVFERTAASLFVIIGTSHYSGHRFTLTRKHFKTPLGVVPTDQDYIDRLVRHYGDGLFDDELQAHLPEHSIELEVVFLQWHYAGRRPIRIVPLVVGSFHDATNLGVAPPAFDDIGRMIEALRRAEAQTKEEICYLISGDLAHIGPKFQRGRQRLAEADLAHSHRQDQALLARLEDADLPGYFDILTAEKDARAICGYPPTYVVLDAFRPPRSRLAQPVQDEQHGRRRHVAVVREHPPRVHRGRARQAERFLHRVEDLRAAGVDRPRGHVRQGHAALAEPCFQPRP